MPTNFRQFSLEVDEFTKDLLPKQFNQFMRLMGLELLRGVVLASPVGNPAIWQSPAPAGYVGGSFRGAWVVTLERPSEVILNRPDESGSHTIARGSKTIGRVRFASSIWLSNNLPYAARIEDGWSHRQAPQGVVRINLARISSRFRRVV